MILSGYLWRPDFKRRHRNRWWSPEAIISHQWRTSIICVTNFKKVVTYFNLKYNLFKEFHFLSTLLTVFNQLLLLKIFKVLYFLKMCPIFVIILVGLTVTLFCEKILISTRCIYDFMSNLIKKSWKDSMMHPQFLDSQ